MSAAEEPLHDLPYEELGSADILSEELDVATHSPLEDEQLHSDSSSELEIAFHESVELHEEVVEDSVEIAPESVVDGFPGAGADDATADADFGVQPSVEAQDAALFPAAAPGYDATVLESDGLAGAEPSSGCIVV